jgi:hypothetical protein
MTSPSSTTVEIIKNPQVTTPVMTYSTLNVFYTRSGGGELKLNNKLHIESLDRINAVAAEDHKKLVDAGGENAPTYAFSPMTFESYAKKIATRDGPHAMLSLAAMYENAEHFKDKLAKMPLESETCKIYRIATAFGFLESADNKSASKWIRITTPQEHLQYLRAQYDEKMKKRPVTRGRMPQAPKQKPKQKTIGNGTQIRNAFTLEVMIKSDYATRMHIKQKEKSARTPTGAYKLKIFSSGVVQMPGCINENYAEVQVLAEFVREFLSWYIDEKVVMPTENNQICVMNRRCNVVAPNCAAKIVIDIPKLKTYIDTKTSCKYVTADAGESHLKIIVTSSADVENLLAKKSYAEILGTQASASSSSAADDVKSSICSGVVTQSQSKKKKNMSSTFTMLVYKSTKITISNYTGKYPDHVREFIEYLCTTAQVVCKAL